MVRGVQLRIKKSMFRTKRNIARRNITKKIMDVAKNNNDPKANANIKYDHMKECFQNQLQHSKKIHLKI